jgi:hypothetical protein
MIVLVSIFLYGNITFSQEIPQTEISNGLIHAKLYLPDSSDGYYQSTRFDWSGVMPSLEHDGHQYFGKWFDEYNPKTHDAIMGPVEEFGPVGYDEPAVGERFLKIGVGTLVKPEEEQYNKFKTYEIANHGHWEVIQNSNELTFKHVLNDQNYAYDYVKRIELVAGKSEMVIHHQFTNNGKSTIQTLVYNHNFFQIDKQNIGPGYVIKFPENITANGRLRGVGTLAEIEGERINFLNNIQKGSQVFMEKIQGTDGKSPDYSFHLINEKSGAGVKIQGDKPISRLTLWSATKTICPEPYITLKAAPGETVFWEISYTFYTL